MIDEICKLPPHLHVLAIVLTQVIFMTIELWLGKTDRTKSASVLELIFNVVKGIFTKKE